MTVYGTAAGFETYHTQRGRDVSWTDAQILAALLVASEWLDGIYGDLWVGTPTDGFTQERQWPRADAATTTSPSYTFPEDEVPQAVTNATYEAALRELNQSGSLNVDFTPSRYAQVRVDGAIQVQYRNDFTSTSDVQVQINVIQTLMSPLLAIRANSPLSGGSSRVV